jgi:hypothetical protein
MHWLLQGLADAAADLPNVYVDLLEGLDKDAFSGGRRAMFGHVEVGDVRHFAVFIRQYAQEGVMVHVGNTRALGAGAEDEHVLAGLARELEVERSTPRHPRSASAHRHHTLASP